MKRLAGPVGLAATVALVTAIGGWWAVPPAAALWSRFDGGGRRWALAVPAGAVGWAVLLVWDAAAGPTALVARRVGGVLSLPAWGFVAVTLCFGGLLAGAGALAGRPARVSGR